MISLVILSLFGFQASTIHLEPPAEGSLFGGQRVTPALVSIGPDRIYIDSLEYLHIYEKCGAYKKSIKVDGWIANFSVLEGKGWFRLSTLNRKDDGSLNYQMLFYDLDGSFLGVGMDDSLADPTQVYFRQLWEIPGDRCLANLWTTLDNDKESIELREVFISRKLGNFYIEYKSDPVYRRYFDSKSAIARDKSVVLAACQMKDRVALYFTHSGEARLNTRDLDTADSINSKISYYSLGLTGFQPLEMEHNLDKSTHDKSLILGMIPNEEGLFVLYRLSHSDQVMIRHFDLYGDPLGDQYPVKKTLVSGAFVGLSGKQLFFYRKTADGEHILLVSTHSPE